LKLTEEEKPIRKPVSQPSLPRGFTGSKNLPNHDALSLSGARERQQTSPFSEEKKKKVPSGKTRQERSE